jgi:hypothetical protein
MGAASPFAKATEDRGEKLPALTCFLSPRRGHTSPAVGNICDGSNRSVNRHRTMAN